jgi:hypothetical protein
MRVKKGRQGEEDYIDPALDYFLAAVEAAETVIIGDGHLTAFLGLEKAATDRDVFGKQVGQRRQAGVFVGIKGINGRSPAPAAAANEADLQEIAAGSVDRLAERKAAAEADTCGQRRLHELPPAS